ncbi:MAG: 30S ribosomal protein S17 [Patescibacteria group bacterium]
METTKKLIQQLKGVVVSTKMMRTVVVEVTRLKKHPRYHKYIRETKRYKAHNENINISEGDNVTIELTRPMSRDKRWRVIGSVKEEKEV